MTHDYHDEDEDTRSIIWLRASFGCLESTFNRSLSTTIWFVLQSEHDANHSLKWNHTLKLCLLWSRLWLCLCTIMWCRWQETKLTKFQPFAPYTKGKSSIQSCTAERPWKSLIVYIVSLQMSSQTLHIFISHIFVLSPDTFKDYFVTRT